MECSGCSSGSRMFSTEGKSTSVAKDSCRCWRMDSSYYHWGYGDCSSLFETTGLNCWFICIQKNLYLFWIYPAELFPSQITLEVLNAGIDCLNQFIAEHTSKQNTRLETFTLEEMTQIVVGSLGKVTINVFALSLVQLKRLDLGMENSIRVYKVRRFY